MFAVSTATTARAGQYHQQFNNNAAIHIRWEPQQPPSGKPTEVISNGRAMIPMKNGHCEHHQQAIVLKAALENTETLAAIRKANELLRNEPALSMISALKLCRELLGDAKMSPHMGPLVAELVGILAGPVMKSLMDTHDQVCGRAFFTPPPSPSILPYDDVTRGEPIRIIGLFKTADEPLGVSLSADAKGRIFISRIHYGSTIDRQGLLRVGDVIKEINTESVVGQTPQQVVDRLQRLSGSVTVKVTPMYKQNFGMCQMFVKAHFDYDPDVDNRLTDKDEAVAFKRGEILEVVDQSNLDWWQAKAVSDSDRGGIIPSSLAEERRRATITLNHKPSKGSIFGKKKAKSKKVMFSSSKHASTFSRLHAPIYEEVTLMPPFERKTLVLSGPSRGGRRTLKDKLISVDPVRFGTTVPYTSRPARHDEESGRGYFFVERSDMMADIMQGRYLEWSEVDGHLYGTKLDSVRDVVRSGKICVLDIKAEAMEVIRTIEFMPLIAFIAPSDNNESTRKVSDAASKPTLQKNMTDAEVKAIVQESEELQRVYAHLLDLVLVNNDLVETYDSLRDAIEEFATKPQWVPVDWVY